MEKVQKALEAIPIPKDGRDGKDGADGIRGKDGAPGINGKDGSSVTIDQVKSVIESYSAEWALDFEKRAHDVLQRTIDRIPKPKDGKDGRVGLSVDDFDVSGSEDGRTITFALVGGPVRTEKSIHFPGLKYLDIWKQGDSYADGDAVTYDGSMWICRKPTKSKPGEYNNDWRLAVKRGRNGKDAEPKGDDK
jgi:hypothetical protein